MSISTPPLPGPFKVQAFGAGPIRIEEVGPLSAMAVALVYATEYRKRARDPQRVALAHAMAEAPAMLAALRKFFSWHADTFGDFDHENNAELLCLANEVEPILARIDGAT